MDIGRIDSNIMSSVIKNAGSAAAQSTDDEFARRLEAAARNSDDKELKKVCQEFEALMLDMIYKQMKATVIRSELVEKDPGREIFESMLDEKLVEQASQGAGLGLADSLYKQLSRQYGRRVPVNSASEANTEKSGTAVEEENE